MVRHLFPYSPAVAWTTDEGYPVPFLMEGCKEA